MYLLYSALYHLREGYENRKDRFRPFRGGGVSPNFCVFFFWQFSSPGGVEIICKTVRVHLKSIGWERLCLAPELVPSWACSWRGFANKNSFDLPNYLQQYPNNLHKTETIKVAEGNIIGILITNFDLEEEGSCGGRNQKFGGYSNNFLEIQHELMQQSKTSSFAQKLSTYFSILLTGTFNLQIIDWRWHTVRLLHWSEDRFL